MWPFKRALTLRFRSLEYSNREFCSHQPYTDNTVRQPNLGQNYRTQIKWHTFVQSTHTKLTMSLIEYFYSAIFLVCLNSRTWVLTLPLSEIVSDKQTQKRSNKEQGCCIHLYDCISVPNICRCPSMFMEHSS